MAAILETQLRSALVHIGQDAFPARPMPPFDICLLAKNPRTKFGHYHLKKREIVVYHLYRPIKAIIITSLHEVAHHLEYLAYGKTGHRKRFYSHYKSVVEATVRLDYLPEDGLASIDDDIKLLEKNVGKLSVFCTAAGARRSDDHTGFIKIGSCSRQHECRLKDMGFERDVVMKLWFLKVTPLTVTGVTRELITFISKESISIQGNREIVLDKDVIIKAYNAYHVRESLRAKGFTFRKDEGGAHWRKQVCEVDAPRIAAEVNKLGHGVVVKVEKSAQEAACQES
jgi:hypothetical protein